MVDRHETERRKVQVTGKSSCMVALPKKWVREIGLKQGSEVTITKLNSAALLVQAPTGLAQASGGEAVIMMNNDDSQEDVLRRIVSLYVLGFRKITVVAKGGLLTSTEKIVLKDAVRRALIGTESIAESSNALSFHVLLGYSDLGVEGALKKMLSVFESLMNDATSVLENGSQVPADSLSQRHDDVKRFKFYVTRQLNLSLNQGAPPELRFGNRDTLGYILIARNLERMTHHAQILLGVTGDLKGAITKQAILHFSSLNQGAWKLVEEALLSLFKRDHQGAGLVVEKSKRFVVMEAGMLDSIRRSDSRTYYMLHLLMDSQKNIVEYARDIAEVVLDMTVERTISRLESNAVSLQYA